MNNLLSYYGLVNATISASEKDLPVLKSHDQKCGDISVAIVEQ